MKIRTYYWHDRVVNPLNLLARKLLNWHPSLFFAKGNAGDIFALDVIRNTYQCEATNSLEQGRMLIVGSLGHTVQEHDVLCGIGVKTKTINFSGDSSKVRVWGARGPISFDAFSRAGFDTSEAKFQYDPGLLIAKYYGNSSPEVQPQDVVYIPHYRERYQRRQLPGEIKFVDIDQYPADLAKCILQAKLVYSSSLHGIIFAHALGRPAVMVRPATDEPMLKFEDYFLSVGLDFVKPLGSIDDANFKRDSDTPVDIDVDFDSIRFPSMDQLNDWGVVSNGNP